jgi:hypothetical protein
MKKAKFKKGQVVRIDTEYYRDEHKGEQFQLITRVWIWNNANKNTPKFGYSFANGDECNEKYVKPLTTKQAGL